MIIVDTGFWLALLNDKDRYHQSAQVGWAMPTKLRLRYVRLWLDVTQQITVTIYWVIVADIAQQIPVTVLG